MHEILHALGFNPYIIDYFSTIEESERKYPLFKYSTF